MKKKKSVAFLAVGGLVVMAIALIAFFVPMGTSKAEQTMQYNGTYTYNGTGSFQYIMINLEDFNYDQTRNRVATLTNTTLQISVNAEIYYSNYGYIAGTLTRYKISDGEYPNEKYVTIENPTLRIGVQLYYVQDQYDNYWYINEVSIADQGAYYPEQPNGIVLIRLHGNGLFTYSLEGFPEDSKLIPIKDLTAYTPPQAGTSFSTYWATWNIQFANYVGTTWQDYWQSMYDEYCEEEEIAQSNVDTFEKFNLAVIYSTINWANTYNTLQREKQDLQEDLAELQEDYNELLSEYTAYQNRYAIYAGMDHVQGIFHAFGEMLNNVRPFGIPLYVFVTIPVILALLVLVFKIMR